MYVYVYEVHGKGVKQSKGRATGLCVHGRLGHLFANDREDMAGELAGVGNTAIPAIWWLL